jgi:hypothetical protein
MQAAAPRRSYLKGADPSSDDKMSCGQSVYASIVEPTAEVLGIHNKAGKGPLLGTAVGGPLVSRLIASSITMKVKVVGERALLGTAVWGLCKQTQCQQHNHAT